jgi:protein-S-isoprenylcysteine O-methyltransferase Ste14
MNENKDHADVKIHPPVVTFVFVILAHLLGRYVRLPFELPLLIQDVGFALIVIGFFLAFAAVLQFRNAGTTLDPHGSVKALVTDGVYKFTRNPIYFGFLLMVIGFPLNGGLYAGVLVAPFFVAVMNSWVIEKEESYLEEKFGETYTGYKSRVRRWL